MSDSKNPKRNLPSWMSSREENKESSSSSNNNNNNNNNNLSKLMEGVVFVLSGFVNPERSTLRSQALEMGAEYQQDWNSDCTLLVCAFPNTPKFRQVEADCGTVVSKDWISECYTQKKLVDIESYLMHVGKPWRRSNASHEINHDQKASPPRKSQKQVERGSHSKPTASASSKSRASNPTKEYFSLSKVKEWAIDDLNKSISWLESQEEKPEPSEIKQIAAEGILTCLQDAIDSLAEKQDVRKITEQWNFVPHVVEELAKLEGTANDSASLSKEDLCKQAKACMRIYEEQLSRSDDDSPTKKKKQKTNESKKCGNGRSKAMSSNAVGYDSDETIEMTEEEIDLAFKTVSSKICK